MTTRIINPSDLRLLYFGTKDVLNTHDEKERRKQRLNHAVSSTLGKDTAVNIFVKLPTGEIVKTQSNVVKYADDVLVLKGGHFIPVRAIVDIAKGGLTG